MMEKEIFDLKEIELLSWILLLVMCRAAVFISASVPINIIEVSESASD